MDSYHKTEKNRLFSALPDLRAHSQGRDTGRVYEGNHTYRGC